MENQEETESRMKDCIFSELSQTSNGETQDEKMIMEIKRCKRIGRYSRQWAQPISVEFKYKEDVKYIMDKKSFLRRGIFVDYEYTSDLEQKRKLLLPIWKNCKANGTLQGPLQDGG